MGAHIKTITALAVTITALSVTAGLALPGTAFAGSPLLSGYGGPGAGEQQIVGSGFVGGAGGGGKGGSMGGGSGESQSVGGSGSSQGTGGRQSNRGGDAQNGNAHGAGTRSGTGGSSRSAGAQGAGTGSGAGSAGNGLGQRGQGTSGANETGHGHTRAGARSPASSVAATTLGLSGGQLAMAGAIAAGLVLAALITGWLGRLQRRDEPVDNSRMSIGPSH